MRAIVGIIPLSLGKDKSTSNLFKLTNSFDVKEGNNIEAVIDVIKNAQRLSGNGKPICIIMHTEMGNGVDYMMGSHKWHGVAPNDEELEIALSQNAETLGDY